MLWTTQPKETLFMILLVLNVTKNVQLRDDMLMEHLNTSQKEVPCSLTACNSMVNRKHSFLLLWFCLRKSTEQKRGFLVQFQRFQFTVMCFRVCCDCKHVVKQSCLPHGSSRKSRKGEVGRDKVHPSRACPQWPTHPTMPHLLVLNITQ
jgi:hypothetical protein